MCGFLFYPLDACELTLDPNTANTYMSLSENNRTVTLMKERQSYSDHPDRFHHWKQLLCTNGLTGRCYWTVERRGCVFIGVTYRGIGRRGKGADCYLGLCDKSWSVCFSHGCYSALHSNRMYACISAPTSVSDRVAVYLDWPAGTLSYRVSSGILIHLHTFQCTFTEPLFPVFGFEYMNSLDSTVSLCQMESKNKGSPNKRSQRTSKTTRTWSLKQN